MSTNDLQFTNISLDPPLSTSFKDNNTETAKYKENKDENRTSFFQVKWFTIFMIVLSFGLLIVCIILAIAFAIMLKQISISSKGAVTETTTSNVFTSTSITSQTITTISVTNSAICGIQEITSDPILPRIYGGTEAVPNSWPWIVFYIEIASCNESECPTYLCGGTLIDPRYILTAAHCISSINDPLIRIVAGLHNISSTKESNIRQVRYVEKIFIHPTFNRLAPLGDIAILQLSIPFHLNKYVQLACLPGAQPKVNDTVIIAGWGSEKYKEEYAPVLKQAFTQIVGDCNAWWSSEGVDETRQICVANNATGASACHGDSGGPLLSKDVDRWVVSGVASYVQKFICNTNRSRPNVYTRVAYYIPWINNIIQSESK